MIEIPLSKGQVAIIDDEDADLAKIKWNAAFHSHYGDGGKFVARRTIVISPGVKTSEYLHRVILGRTLGRKLLPNEKVDHIFGNTLDNRRSQIRLATNSQNQMNKKRQANNTSGYKGVSFHRPGKKWRAYINLNGKRISLGYYHTPEAAHNAYLEAAHKYFGEYMRIE